MAAYFQALSEPTRLQILNLLRSGERNVGELAQLVRLHGGQRLAPPGAAHQHGLVARESRGTSVYYRIADESVYALCDLVCGNIARHLNRAASGRQVFARSARPAAKARARRAQRR